MQKKINVGGQAVIEGVMIRGPQKYAVAARKKGKIVYKKGSVPSTKNSFMKLPFIRGFFNLADMMVIGIKSIMWSAQQAGESDQKITKKEITFTLLLSIAVVIIFFITLPYFLTHLFGIVEEKKPFFFNIIDGLIRISIFLIYIFAISFFNDVKKLCQYHAAEHMAIHCYEHGNSLNSNNVKKFTTLHPRCGTSFLFIVLIVSIFVFSLLPSIISHYYAGFVNLSVLSRKGILFPIRILLIPFVAGISYEILKISDKKQDNILFKAISMPGLWLQKITTRKPNNRQIEVAVASLKKLLEIENSKN